MTISRRFALAGVASAPIAAALPSPSRVSRRDLHVVTSDKVRIHVRELRPGSPDQGRPLLLLHGARVPGIASFDLDVPNGTLAADLAVRLNRVLYVLDARGYGASERPVAMEQPAAENAPLSRAYEVVRDIDAVVNTATQLCGTSQADLYGWATGGAWAAYYASLWPERVAHLVTVNALYGATAPHAMLGPGSDTADPAHPDRLNPAIRAYALATGASLLGVWDRSIRESDKSLWRDPAIAHAYVATALASDPDSAKHDPPAFRAPSGALEDSFYQAAGRRLYDSSSITSRVLVVRSERDFWSRPQDATNFSRDAARARSMRVVTIPDATHFVHLDRPQHGRNRLLLELDAFLGN